MLKIEIFFLEFLEISCYWNLEYIKTGDRVEGAL